MQDVHEVQNVSLCLTFLSGQFLRVFFHDLQRYLRSPGEALSCGSTIHQTGEVMIPDTGGTIPRPLPPTACPRTSSRKRQDQLRTMFPLAFVETDLLHRLGHYNKLTVFGKPVCLSSSARRRSGVNIAHMLFTMCTLLYRVSHLVCLTLPSCLIAAGVDASCETLLLVPV